MRKIVLLLLTLFNFSWGHAQQDSVLSQPKSLDEEGFDCTKGFIQRLEKPVAPSKVFVVTKSLKTVKLPAFMATIYSHSGEFINAPSTVELPKLQDYGLIDLDKDGKKELVVMNYTGGAHCCDEFYFFKNIGPDKYQYVAKTFAGDVCVSDSNEFSYSFYQQLGYFFTCFACAYVDTSDGAPVEVRGIILKYQKGKLTVVPGDQELRSIINDNLGKLGEQPYEKPDTAFGQDNGLRKEFAMNLAVFHFSFGRNILETQNYSISTINFRMQKSVGGIC
ncbi:MAG: hypothetical protein IPI68_12880 [Chitinophagaceae bacterium]|nr:hypothetical protein [Chitinophagaceae bacterium]